MHLDVSANALTSVGVDVLLPCCTHLRSLCLAQTGCRGEQIQTRLCVFVENASNLVHLSLAQNTFENASLKAFGQSLARNMTLVSLDMAGTAVEVQGVGTLTGALVSMQSLTHLDLSKNKLDENLGSLMPVAFSAVLSRLCLNQNPLLDEGARQLSEILQHSTLQHLELGSCRIGSPGAAHVFKCFAKNEWLRFLSLRDNFLDEELSSDLLAGMEHVHDMALLGNRLPHTFLLAASRTCARNQQATRDKEPKSLQKKVHRLLHEETKLERAQRQQHEDDQELSMRKAIKDEANHDLRHLLCFEAELQRQLKCSVVAEEQGLEAQRLALVRLRRELKVLTAQYTDRQRELRQRRDERERRFMDLQVEFSELDNLLARRKIEHPAEIARVKDCIRVANIETDGFHEQAKQTKLRLRALQEQTLIGFKL